MVNHTKLSPAVRKAIVGSLQNRKRLSTYARHKTDQSRSMTSKLGPCLLASVTHHCPGVNTDWICTCVSGLADGRLDAPLPRPVWWAAVRVRGMLDASRDAVRRRSPSQS